MKVYNELTVLIAEDDDGHAELIVEGLKESGVCNPILRFIDGDEIWKFLSGKAINTGDTYVAFNSDKSYLLLLDINMPKMDGIEVLKRMKSDNVLKNIPVMMLTTTDDPKEVKECYKLGCNIYITKPVVFTKFTETLHRLGLFLQIVKI